MTSYICEPYPIPPDLDRPFPRSSDGSLPSSIGRLSSKQPRSQHQSGASPVLQRAQESRCSLQVRPTCRCLHAYTKGVGRGILLKSEQKRKKNKKTQRFIIRGPVAKLSVAINSQYLHVVTIDSHSLAGQSLHCEGVGPPD